MEELKPCPLELDDTATMIGFRFLHDEPFDHCCMACKFRDTEEQSFPCAVCKCTADSPESADYKTRYFYYMESTGND